MKKIVIILLVALLAVACHEDKGRVVKPKSGPAQMVLQENDYNFGQLGNEPHFVEHVFKFVNEGSQKLVINNVHAYCHCTTVDYPQEPVKPGHAAELRVQLNTHDLTRGHFTRTIDVYHSGKGGKVTLSIRGDKLED